MSKNQLWLALSALALVSVGGVIGAAVTRLNLPLGQSNAAPANAIATGIPFPSEDRALRDLLGAPKTGALPTVQGRRIEIWTTREFSVGEVRYHAVFFARKPLDSTGSQEKCHACAPELASVTYRRVANDWELASRDAVIAELGSFGELPPVQNMTTLALGTSPAFAIADRWMGQGEVSAGANLIAYRSGWKYLGWVPTGRSNAGALFCESDPRCYAWWGTLNVLAIGSSEFPDLMVERVGLEPTVSGDRTRLARMVTYEFNGSSYVEKSETSNANAAQASQPVPAKASTGTPGGAIETTPARQWYAADLNFTRCIKTRSPANRIQMIQEYGKRAKVVDLPNGAVEVAEQTSSLEEQVWTYYRSEEACTAALPRSQPIPSKYR